MTLADSELCPICAARMAPAFRATLLGRHDVSYFLCDGCGLLRTEKPYWMEEAYTSAIASIDCGLVARNIAHARVMSLVYAAAFRREDRFVDIAGGYGLFTRLMRDRGFDCTWDDPHCHNLLAIGCEASSREGPVAAVSALEVLEHVYDPVGFIDDTMRRFTCQCIFLSTETYSGRPPTRENWAYYACETGQHIAFFQVRTLQALADRFGLVYRRLGPVHALCAPGRIPWWLSSCCGRISHLLALVAVRNRRSLTVPDYQRLVAAVSAAQTSPEHSGLVASEDQR